MNSQHHYNLAVHVPQSQYRPAHQHHKQVCMHCVIYSAHRNMHTLHDSHHGCAPKLEQDKTVLIVSCGSCTAMCTCSDRHVMCCHRKNLKLDTHRCHSVKTAGASPRSRQDQNMQLTLRIRKLTLVERYVCRSLATSSSIEAHSLFESQASRHLQGPKKIGKYTASNHIYAP